MKLCLVVALNLFLFPFQSVGQQIDSIAYINIDQFKIANVTLGSSLNIALKAFGKPDSIEDLSNSIDSMGEQLYYLNGVTILVSDAKVSRIECINPKYKTPQGIRVGDRTAKIFKALKKTEIWKFEGRDRVQYILWPPCDTYLIFELQDNLISKIILDFIP